MHETIGGPVMPVLDPEVMTPPPELPPGSLYTHYLNQELNLNGYNTNVGQLFRLCPFYDQIHDQELTPEKLEELDQYTAKFLAKGGIEISKEFVHLVKTTETPKPEQPDAQKAPNVVNKTKTQPQPAAEVKRQEFPPIANLSPVKETVTRPIPRITSLEPPPELRPSLLPATLPKLPVLKKLTIPPPTLKKKPSETPKTKKTTAPTIQQPPPVLAPKLTRSPKIESLPKKEELLILPEPVMPSVLPYEMPVAVELSILDPTPPLAYEAANTLEPYIPEAAAILGPREISVSAERPIVVDTTIFAETIVAISEQAPGPAIDLLISEGLLAAEEAPIPAPPIGLKLAERLQATEPSQKEAALPIIKNITETLQTLHELQTTGAVEEIILTEDKLEEQCRELLRVLRIDYNEEECKQLVTFLLQPAFISKLLQAEAPHEEGTHERKPNLTAVSTWLTDLLLPAYISLGQLALAKAYQRARNSLSAEV